MAKYISIPTTITGNPVFSINADLVTTVAYVNTASINIWSGIKNIQLAVSGAAADRVIVAINNAILNQAGPSQIQVVLPTGINITGVTVL